MKSKVLLTAVALAFSSFTGLVSDVAGTPILAEYQDGETYAFDGWTGSAAHEDGQSTTLGANQLTFADGGGSGVAVGGNANAISLSGAETLGGTDLYSTGAFGASVNLANYAGISFDFYAEDVDNFAGYYGMYFQSSSSDTVWYYSLSQMPTAGVWGNYNAPLSYSGYWSGYNISGANAALITTDISTAFNTALADADALGFFVSYAATGGGGSQTYGIDDFGLTVPEPETYMALGMALLGMAFVFRKRITESLAEARAMIQV